VRTNPSAQRKKTRKRVICSINLRETLSESSSSVMWARIVGDHREKTRRRRSERLGRARMLTEKPNPMLPPVRKRQVAVTDQNRSPSGRLKKRRCQRQINRQDKGRSRTIRWRMTEVHQGLSREPIILPKKVESRKGTRTEQGESPKPRKKNRKKE